MLHKIRKVKYARQTLESLYGINTTTSRKIIGLLELHPQALEHYLFLSRRKSMLSGFLASLRIDFKLKLIVFARICLQIKLGSVRGTRLLAGLPAHGQRTHANGKTAKRRQLLPFRFRKYTKTVKEKKESRKNIKKKISKTKQKKLARPKQKVKKKKKE